MMARSPGGLAGALPPILPHVPAGYRRMPAEHHTLWCDARESAAHVALLRETMEELVPAMCHATGFEARRELHVCCYATNVVARRLLARPVPGGMALAPFCDAARALIVVQSSAADPANGDAVRLRRLLAHELAHQWVAEVTGSRKRLGDGRRDMRIPSWLDEGFAVVASELLGGRVVLLEQALARFRTAADPMTFADIDARLDDLDSAERCRAFTAATGAVYSLVRAHGLASVLAALTGLAAAIAPGDRCAPSSLDVGSTR